MRTNIKVYEILIPNHVEKRYFENKSLKYMNALLDKMRELKDQ